MKKVCTGYLADAGCAFVLAAHGYQSTPDAIKPERAVGKPVPGFSEKVPCSWVEKGYVVEKSAQQTG